MKTITLLTMEIEHFKGIGHCVLDFGGRSCVIYGDNAVGKSSVCDAWHWLLFGKNRAGASAFDIKPLDREGKVADPSAVTSVTAKISINGVEYELRRTYYEKWSQKRGSAEKSFDGNTSDFYIDGVPMKKSEYEAVIRDKIAGGFASGQNSDDVFTLITSLYAFNEGMNMQSRRKVLYDMCGVMSDGEIIASSEQFAPLAEPLGKFTIEELKKKLGAERQSLNKEKLKIPARIDECRKIADSVKGVDFGALSVRLGEFEAEREQLSAELIRINNNAALAGKENELAAVTNKQDALEMRNRMHRKNQEPRRDTSLVDAWRAGVQAAERAYESVLKRKKEAERMIAIQTDHVEALRHRWAEIAKETLTQAESCPLCGRAYDKEALSRAREAFEAEKEVRKARIAEEADGVKKCLEEYESELAAVHGELDSAERSLEELRASKPQDVVQEVIITDLPEYEEEKAALWDEADRIRREIEDLRSGSGHSRALLSARLSEVRREIDRIQGELGRKAVLDEMQERIEELRETDRELARSLNENDRLQFLCEEFIRYKVSLIEESVNSRFRLARFKLFDVQVNGGLVDCCEATADGVPYGSVNHGTAVNLGLDIIETLSEYYGIRAPLFIDNGESVTRFIETSSQVIRLCVSEKDKELRVEVNEQNHFEKAEREGAHHESDAAA